MERPSRKVGLGGGNRLANSGVNRTKVRKVSQDFSIICHINMLGAWQILGFVAFPSTWPYSTVAATRPNKERREPFEFPFSHLILAIRDENHRKGGCGTLKGHEKVLVLVDLGNWL